MEININLFHEKPMFSFRCKKEDKKRIKKLAKEVHMDVDEFILDATRKYRAMIYGIPFGELRKCISPFTRIETRQFGNNKAPCDILENIDDEYDDYPVIKISTVTFSKYNNPDFADRPGIYIELGSTTIDSM